jgi:membrane protein implicated in regulation of membrane protease activity
MKFESMILGTLFVACFGICALVMGAMLTAKPAAVQMTGATPSASSVATTQAHCTQRIDAARCAGSNG